MATTNNNPINHNVGFKLGLQATVDALLAKGSNAGASAGSFYLTSDTHRLYIANSDTSLSPVNEGVTTVTNISDLPNVTSANASAYVGRFYYVSGTKENPINILCVYNGSGWAQINTDTYVKEIAFTAEQTTSNTEVTLTETLTNWNGTNISHGEPSDSMTFKGSNGIHVKVLESGEYNPETDTYDPHPIIEFEGDTYTVSSDVVKDDDDKVVENQVALKLDSAKTGNDSKVIFQGGKRSDEKKTNVEVSQDKNVITITARDTVNTDFEITSEKDKAGFTFAVYDNHGGDATTKTPFDPVIKFGAKGDQTAHFIGDGTNGGTATLNVYTIDEINETLRVLNAMTYRGTIGTAGTAASKIIMVDTEDATKGCTMYDGNTEVKVSIGDMFMVVGNQSVQYIVDKKYAYLSANTLLIARSTTGKEEDGAYIKSEHLIFDVVKSTVDTDTTYKFETSEGTAGQSATVTLRPSTPGQAAGSLTIETVRSNTDKTETGSVTGLKLTRTTDENNKNDKWVIEHDVTAFDTNTTGAAFVRQKGTVAGVPVMQYEANVLTGIKKNASGHIIGYTVQKMPIIDSNSIIDTISHETSHYISGTDRYIGVQKTTTVEKLNTGGGGETNDTVDEFAFVSDSLHITAGSQVATSADSGASQAASLQIDLVWGTF